MKHRIYRLLIALLCSAACAAEPDKHLSLLKLPPGFTIAEVVKAPGARSMTFSPDGTLFIGTREAGKVYAYRDNHLYTLASGLDQPNGVAFHDGALYVGAHDRILRFDHIENSLANPPAPVVVNDSFPHDRGHGWKFIKFGPDGLLYIPVGAPGNIGLWSEEDPRYASIMRMRPDGTHLEVFAKGVRNSVGFDWHPSTHELWFTDNGRDMLGDDLPPDELNRAPQAGLHFGYPYWHGGDIPDPQYGSRRPQSDFVKPVQKLGPHVASLGMRFYTGSQFPGEYKGQIFIAEHGSWNRSHKIGYRVTLVRLNQAGEAISYQPFVDGWLQGESAWGRPVDVEVAPDGSLLISDDQSGRIYRVSYRRP
jgi:glucose/arabinose dehydrogenase